MHNPSATLLRKRGGVGLTIVTALIALIFFFPVLIALALVFAMIVASRSAPAYRASASARTISGYPPNRMARRICLRPSGSYMMVSA